MTVVTWCYPSFWNTTANFHRSETSSSARTHRWRTLQSGLSSHRGIRCARRTDRQTIKVRLLKAPPLDRAEIFENTVFMTFFSDAMGLETRFPRTVAYERSGAIYESINEAAGDIALSVPEDRRLDIDHNTILEALREFLRRLREGVGDVALMKWWREMQFFRNEYMEILVGSHGSLVFTSADCRIAPGCSCR